MSAEPSHVTDISSTTASGAAAKKPGAPGSATPQPKRATPIPPLGASAERAAADAMAGVSRFFEDSQERMKSAFDQASGQFDTFRSAAREAGDVFQSSSTAALNGMKRLSEQTIEGVQNDVDRCYDCFKALSEAKSPTEYLQVQADFVRETLEAQLDQGRQLTELTVNVFKSAFEPLQTGLASVIDNARKRS